MAFDGGESKRVEARRGEGAGPRSTGSFILFCASVPLMLPVLDALTSRAWPSDVIAAGYSSQTLSFVNPLLVSALFTVFALLFTSLEASRPVRLGAGVKRIAAACYAGGYLAAAGSALAGLEPSFLLPLAGATLGFGSACMSIHWIGSPEADGFRSSLAAAVTAAGVTVVSALVCSLVPTKAALLLLAGCALASSVGFALHASDSSRSRRANAQRASVAEAEPKAAPPSYAPASKAHSASDSRAGDTAFVELEGPDWWEIFGKLDLSCVSEADDLQAPRTRRLFFIVVPLVMIALFAADRLVFVGVGAPVSPVTLGALCAIALCLPMLRIASDRSLLNFAFRFFLPLVAFAAFALSAFVPDASEHAVLAIGGFAFLTAYGLSMSAMLMTMAGRIRTLGLPAAGFIVIVSCIACLIAFEGPPALANLSGPGYLAFLSFFLAAAALLVVTPGSRLWRVLLEGIESDVESLDPTRPYLDRVAAVSQSFELTPRESEVLELLGRGHTSAFIAERLVISESTARSHRKNIYRKLSLSSREELFALIDSTEQA